MYARSCRTNGLWSPFRITSMCCVRIDSFLETVLENKYNLIFTHFYYYCFFLQTKTSKKLSIFLIDRLKTFFTIKYVFFSANHL